MPRSESYSQQLRPGTGNSVGKGLFGSDPFMDQHGQLKPALGIRTSKSCEALSDALSTATVTEQEKGGGKGKKFVHSSSVEEGSLITYENSPR